MKFLAWWLIVGLSGVITIWIIHLIIIFSENFLEYWFYVYIFIVLFILWWIAGLAPEEDKNK